MKLTACLMVRNEEANLPRALASLQNAVDEILVIDTGSTDRTVSIALEHGAQVLCSPWKDDFCTPRNVGWDYARGEWMLWLDGDESLVEASIPHLQACVNRTDVSACYILRQELDDVSQPDRGEEMIMLRLHRRDLPTRFTGEYHSQILPPLPSAPKSQQWGVAQSEVRIKHWRAKVDPTERATRSARILARELEKEPDHLYNMIELANSWIDLGDPRGPDLMRKAAQKLNPNDEHAPTTVAMYVLDRLILAPREAELAGLSFEQLKSMALRWFPNHPALKWAIAQRLFVAEDFASAATLLRDIVRLVQTKQVDKVAPFNPRAAEDAEFNLAVCLVRLAEIDEAEGIFKRYVEHPLRGESARANLKVIAQLRTMLNT